MSLRVEPRFASISLQIPRLKNSAPSGSALLAQITQFGTVVLNILNIFYSTCSTTVNMFPLLREETQTALLCLSCHCRQSPEEPLESTRLKLWL